jgi:hypothetical protein
MVAKEQLMSEAKRDQCAFQQSALAGRTIGLRKPPRLEPCMAPIAQELRLVESWDNKGISSGDPYNGMGARAGNSHVFRK